jgi:hypothetical protein
MGERCQTGKPPTNETAVDFNEKLARQAAAINDQDECDDPDCACHQEAGDRPHDGLAEVTMTEVYEDESSWGRPCGW